MKKAFATKSARSGSLARRHRLFTALVPSFLNATDALLRDGVFDESRCFIYQPSIRFAFAHDSGDLEKTPGWLQVIANSGTATMASSGALRSKSRSNNMLGASPVAG